MIENLSILGCKEIFDIVIDFTTLLVLALTLFWIKKYTQETEEMKKEMIKQTDLSMQPYFVIEIDKGRGYFCLENIGNGIALDVNVKFLKAKVDNENLTLQGDSFNNINKNIKKGIKIIATYNQGKNIITQSLPTPMLSRVYAEIEVNYKNIANQKRKPEKFILKEGIITKK